jgi:hypothetical protein
MRFFKERTRIKNNIRDIMVENLKHIRKIEKGQILVKRKASDKMRLLSNPNDLDNPTYCV